MAGTDELFPDATEHPGVALSTPRPRRGLGIAAFILGMFAVLGDLLGIVVAFAALAGAVTHVGETLSNVDNSLGALLGVVVLEFVVFIGGIVVGLIAGVLGILAAVTGRGRVIGVVGAVLGLIVLVGHVILGVVIGSSGNVPGVTS